MKIISWNPNGIRALLKKIKINEFLQNHKPDILCFNEIKASHPENNLYFQTFFKHQYWNISEKKGYAGTCIFSNIKPLNIIKSPFDNEGRLICLEFEDFFLINVYTPNAGQELKRLDYRVKEWDVKFQEFVGKFQKPSILVGDFNVAHKPIDLARPKSNEHSAGFTKEERDSFQELLNLGFIDSFRMFYPDKVQYSYWGYRFKCREKNLGWRIDYGLVSEKLKDKIKSSEILDNQLGSDHCPIILELD